MDGSKQFEEGSLKPKKLKYFEMLLKGAIQMFQKRHKAKLMFTFKSTLTV